MASVGDGLELTADPSSSTKSIRLLLAICVVGVLVGGAGLVAPRAFGSRDEFAAFMRAEQDKWGKVLKEIQIKPE